MPKVPKVQAGYLPARYVAGKGTSCDSCRDFIKLNSECMILDPPLVSGPMGTCILYVKGKPHEYGSPLRLLPQRVAGYIEGNDVPTYCGRCEYYEHPNHNSSTCKGIGNSEDDTVEFGGCCNHYEARK